MPKLKLGTIWPTDEEEADIQRQIAEDPDDSAHWEDSDPPRPAVEVDPELVAHSLRTRGKQKSPTKVAISIRLDADIVRHLQASGAGWQTRLNRFLREALALARGES